ncbi:uncharacterized protein LOC118735626 isoform X1 [Rhagoletis pomonella]|uniref:uncharacterized protein LOC118735626 isoform X1 n=1 Tax=Rhagoletis pomonella TaxID=28610 RepID=UPI0017840C68|nr:uncharacterized protein LOC118735626 isoform X1 [Rhagoletis pomonella]
MKVERLKLRRNFWTSGEIECMLDLLREVHKMQRNTATTNYTFVQIATKMKRRGFPNKSAQQIRRKWFQMKSAYLCYKRGNVERLLLIPEKFRSTIAQFVDREVQPTNYQEVSPSPSPPPAPSSSLPLPPPIAPEVVQAPTPPLINSNTKAKVQDTFNAPKPPVAFGKRVYRDNRFDEFLVRVKQTHKIINNDFLNMQKILMDFEHACQKERDAKIVSFIKSINYDF